MTLRHLTSILSTDMGPSIKIVLVLLASGATVLVASSGDPRSATVTAVWSVPCEKQSNPSVNCHRYRIKIGSDVFYVRPKKDPEEAPLTLGQVVQVRFKKDKAYVRTADESKEQEFRVENTTSDIAPGEVLKVGNGFSAPAVIKEVEPYYPEDAKRERVQGIVVLSGIVSANGRATNIRVVRGIGRGLDEEAVAALRRWVFRPAMKDGHPIAVASTFEIHFRLY